MQRTRWQTLLGLALAVGLGAHLVLRALDGRGGLAVPVPALTALGPALLAAVVGLLGHSVRRMVAGEESRMTALGASRVVLLAKASALGGAVLTGYFAAQLILTLDHLGAPALRAQAWASAAALLTSLVLVGIGLLVEWWCRIPPDDDEPDNLVGDTR